MQNRRTSSIRIVTALCGLALGLGACQSTSPWAAQRGPAPVAVAQQTPPSTTPAFVSEPYQSIPISAPPAAAPDWNTVDSGWSFTQSAASAERSTTSTNSSWNNNTGTDMSSRIYSGLLSLDLPAESAPGQQSAHTVNIHQISFAHDGANFDPKVSRDGQTLVFSSTQHRTTSDIYMQRVGSRVVSRLTDDPAHDVMPAISPDGSRIAFSSNRSGSWDIFVMPITGGKAVQITSEAANDLHPSWSPDGQKLVFSRLGTTSGRWELWVVDVFNAAQTEFIGYGLFPEWSPLPATGFAGADQILFQRSRERGKRTFSIWTLDYNRSTHQASNETEVVSNPAYALINPTWSPDAARIVYAAVPNPEEWSGRTDIAPTSASLWMVGVDGRGQVNLTSGSSVDLMPAWGGNGRVFFVSNRGGVENLWSLEIAPAILAATGELPKGGETFTSAPADRE